MTFLVGGAEAVVTPPVGMPLNWHPLAVAPLRPLHGLSFMERSR
jgi:hypothetical protein